MHNLIRMLESMLFASSITHLEYQHTERHIKLRTGWEVWALLLMAWLFFLCRNCNHNSPRRIAHPPGQLLQREWYRYYLILGTVNVSNMKGVSFS